MCVHLSTYAYVVYVKLYHLGWYCLPKSYRTSQKIHKTSKEKLLLHLSFTVNQRNPKQHQLWLEPLHASQSLMVSPRCWRNHILQKHCSLLAYYRETVSTETRVMLSLGYFLFYQVIDTLEELDLHHQGYVGRGD